MQPAISIVVPSYNQPPEFVSECLASIFAQKGASYEVIFVDGQSNPETLAAVEPFRSRCAHFISEPDEGQADAINKGLRRARGSLVAWLNTDDFYAPGAFQHMENACKKNPAAPFHMGIGFRTDQAGKARRPFYPDNFRFNRRSFVAGLNYILQPATFIRREALQKAGITPKSAEVAMIPKAPTEVDVETGKKIVKLMEMLDEHDDVQNVYSSARLTEEMLE